MRLRAGGLALRSALVLNLFGVAGCRQDGARNAEQATLPLMTMLAYQQASFATYDSAHRARGAPVSVPDTHVGRRPSPIDSEFVRQACLAYGPSIVADAREIAERSRAIDRLLALYQRVRSEERVLAIREELVGELELQRLESQMLVKRASSIRDSWRVQVGLRRLQCGGR